MTTIQTADNTNNSAGATATAFGISYSVTSILSALLVVLKESNQTVFDALVALTGHHWVSQGVLDVVVFVALGFVLSRTSYARMTAKSLIITIVSATGVSGLIIAGFFI